MTNFGVDVTIVEFLDRMVPTEDADVSKELLKQYKKLGVKVLLSTKVENVEDTGSGVKVTVSPADGGDSQVLEADKMLAAFGFAPRVDGYGLENAGVELTDRGAIAVDARGRTNVDGIYAIGDVTGKLMLAHTAEAMGIVAAETIAGRRDDRDRLRHDPAGDVLPAADRVVRLHRGAGQGEGVRRQGRRRSRSRPTARPAAWPRRVGFVKIVADAEHNEIVGAHLIGPEVTELLPALTLAQKWDLTADEVARNVFAHPTLSEAMKEAVEGIAGHMINL